MLIVAVVLAVFGRLLWADFTWWDDWATVHHNPHMQHVNWDTFTHYWAEPAGDIYVPLTYTIWGLLSLVAVVAPDEVGTTLNPLFFHAVNIVAHAGGALAAYGLLRRLTRNDTAALLGALLWAVHPVQVESVGWVSGLKDVLSGALVLAAVLLFVRYRQDGRRAAYAASVVVYVLAMLAKPSAFTTPLLLVVIDRLVLKTSWKHIAVAMIAFAVVTVPVAVIARTSQPALVGEATPVLRVLGAGNTLAFYALKIVAPVELAFDYGRNIRTLRTRADLYYAWLLPAGVLAATVWAYRRARRRGRPLSPLPAVGLLVLALAPVHVLGLVRFDYEIISIAADHYLYVAVFGAAVLLAWAVTARPKLVPLAVVLIAAYGARAAWQTRVWQDDETLLANELAVNPNSWTGYANRAIRLATVRDYDGELRNLLKARAIRPDDANLNIGLLAHYLNTKQLAEAHVVAREIINIYNRQYLPTTGSYAAVYTRIVPMFLTVHQPDAAERYVTEALRLAPNDPDLAQLVRQIERLRRARAFDAAATRPATGPGVK